MDIYYIGTQGAQCVGTLGRDDFYDTDSCADYINIEARSGVITTYDSSFNAVQRRIPSIISGSMTMTIPWKRPFSRRPVIMSEASMANMRWLPAITVMESLTGMET